jgi:hypothetical protein
MIIVLALESDEVTSARVANRRSGDGRTSGSEFTAKTTPDHSKAPSRYNRLRRSYLTVIIARFSCLTMRLSLDHGTISGALLRANLPNDRSLASQRPSGRCGTILTRYATKPKTCLCIELGQTAGAEDLTSSPALHRSVNFSSVRRLRLKASWVLPRSTGWNSPKPAATRRLGETPLLIRTDRRQQAI